MAYITCAESKKEEVVDEVLVLSHAKFLRSEKGFNKEVPYSLGLVLDEFWHELC